MRFLLGADDRARYGLGDEPIDVDLDRLTNREADLLEAAAPDGPGIPPDEWYEVHLKGDPAEDANGAPVINDATGEQVRRWNRHTVAIIMWLGVRRAGVAVAWPDWEFDLNSIVQFKPEPEPDPNGDEAGPGKDDAPTPSSDGS